MTSGLGAGLFQPFPVMIHFFGRQGGPTISGFANDFFHGLLTPSESEQADACAQEVGKLTAD